MTPHSVNPTPAGFEVLSGRSGNTYLVVPLTTGGAACTCPRGREALAIASDCSHVKAVTEFAMALPKPFRLDLREEAFDHFRKDAEEFIRSAAMADNHSSDVDPGTGRE
jgi:uncharacterized Zn finger protein